MTASEFLEWLADRLVRKYGESENEEHIVKLRELATRLRDMEL